MNNYLNKQNLEFMLDTRYGIIETVVKNWNSNILTTLKLKEALRERFPHFYWDQEYVSDFMKDTDYSFTDNGSYRVYSLIKTPMYKSNTKGLIPINDMATRHIENALYKRYGTDGIQDVLAYKDSELFYLLKEYFSRHEV